MRAGRALQKEGDYTRAEALLESAYAGLDPGDRRRAVELLEALSRTQWSLGRAEDARATIARAVELIPAENDSPDHARVLAWQAKASMLQGRYGETVPIARQAIAVAERANAAGPRSDALERARDRADLRWRHRGWRRLPARGDGERAVRCRAAAARR